MGSEMCIRDRYNANMLANEMYLDSADQRTSVVSLAKQVGYTPRSASSARATINVLMNNATGSTVTMSRGTKFTTTVDDTNYSFVNNADVSISPQDGVYQFSDLEIYEGTYLNYKYTANTSDKDQRFIIPIIMLIQQLLLLKFKNLLLTLQQIHIS